MLKDSANDHDLNPVIHPAWLRVSHWINVVAIIVMIMSGWRIYNASPLFDFYFPQSITLGGWLGGALLWHFAAMWVFAINGVFYILMNIISRKFLYKIFPLKINYLLNDIKNLLKGNLSHDDSGKYNQIQRIFYLFIILDLIFILMSGLVLWKSTQFPFLRELMGGYETARWIHFCCMSVIVAFAVLHIFMAFLVPKSLASMVLGRSFSKKSSQPNYEQQ